MFVSPIPAVKSRRLLFYYAMINQLLDGVLRKLFSRLLIRRIEWREHMLRLFYEFVRIITSICYIVACKCTCVCLYMKDLYIKEKRVGETPSCDKNCYCETNLLGAV